MIILEVLALSSTILIAGFILIFLVFIYPAYRIHYKARRNYKWKYGICKDLPKVKDIIKIKKYNNSEKYYLYMEDNHKYEKYEMSLTMIYVSENFILYFRLFDYIKYFFWFEFILANYNKKIEKKNLKKQIYNNKIKEE